MQADFPAPSAPISEAFDAWRTAYMVHAKGGFDDDGAADAACHIHGSRFCELVATPVANAGDFLVKAYVELLGRCGAPLRSGNDFDIDNVEFDGNGRCDDAYMHSLYRDLDSCDLGRCLLGTGSLVFDPARWLDAMEAAEGDALVIVGPDGDKRLSIVMYDDEDPVRDRQQLRLRRLAASRTAEIGNYIFAHHLDKVAHLSAAA